MQRTSRSSCAPLESHLIMRKALTDEDREAVMRLRFEVFNLELNEGLQSSYLTGVDTDEFDPYCDHIMIVDVSQDLVIGTYRLLLGSRAEKGIGYYAEREFEISDLRRLRGEKLELGRACVHSDYRGSTVLSLMWAGIARYIERYHVNYLFGCGSIHTIDPVIVSSIYSHLKNNNLIEHTCKITPLKAVPGFNPDTPPEKGTYAKHIPPLLTAYLRLGARIQGEPALDEEFGVSDFFILLNRHRMLNRYSKRYLSLT
jgi:L-ornithine Nalpha-acyltransferase